MFSYPVSKPISEVAKEEDNAMDIDGKAVTEAFAATPGIQEKSRPQGITKLFVNKRSRIIQCYYYYYV